MDMKNIVSLTPDTLDAIKAIVAVDPEIFKPLTTIELGEQTLRVLNSISWQLKRMADAWESGKDRQEVVDENENAKAKPKKDRVKANNASQPKWTPEEDDILMKLVEVIGPRWALIARTKKLPGRSPASIGSRYIYISGKR